MILVIGGTGTTGRLVAEQLTGQGQQVRIASRRPAGGAVRFDWYDPTSHADVLAGVHAVYLIAPTGAAEPAPVMLPFLHRARQAGVRRAVLLSSSAVPAGEHGLGLVHTRLGTLFPEWAVLRPSWFMENFVGDHLHAVTARDAGEIVSATGTGRVGFVDPADIAAVAVRALTDPTSHDTDHLITGPQALSYADVAAILTGVLGHPVRHRAVTEDELAERHTVTGMPSDYARFLASLDTAIAGGAEDRTTATVAEVTGHPPRTFHSFCAHRFGPARPAPA
ncbi:NAD(P)H-binding protein [Micromonospora rifamycinica]|uniref:NAD(P)H-binding protein n=1 Tax=Micromonospora rifamycinica TaxID=291594 RepID=UPI0033CF6F6B